MLVGKLCKLSAMKLKFRYTNRKARDLTKKKSVQCFLKVATRLSCNSDQSISDVVKKEMKGFKHLDYPDSGSADVFVNEKDKVVIKLNGVFDVCEKPPKRAIETAFAYHLKNDLIIRIQPLADVSLRTKQKAMKFFEKLEIKQTGLDLHSGNVGKYKNKFVMIDW